MIERQLKANEEETQQADQEFQLVAREETYDQYLKNLENRKKGIKTPPMKKTESFNNVPSPVASPSVSKTTEPAVQPRQPAIVPSPPLSNSSDGLNSSANRAPPPPESITNQKSINFCRIDRRILFEDRIVDI